jgi:DNA-binding transcriptional LysR family regulator
MVGSGKRLTKDIEDEVKIAVGPQVASYLSGPLYRQMKRTHPNIRLSIGDAVSDNLRADMIEGRTDIAVFMRSGRALNQDDREICSGETYLIGLPDSEATANETIPFAQLEGLPLLLPSQQTEWRRWFDSVAARRKVSLSVVAEANAPGSRAAMVHDGVGYLILPMLVGKPAARVGWLAADIRAKRLRAARIVNPNFPIKLVVSIGSKRRHSVEIVASVIETMLNELTEDAPADDEASAA